MSIIKAGILGGSSGSGSGGGGGGGTSSTTGDLSKYTLLTTTAAVSGTLQNQINTEVSTSIHIATNDTITGLKTFTQSISAVGNIVDAGYLDFVGIATPTFPNAGIARMYAGIETGSGFNFVKLHDSTLLSYTVGRDVQAVVLNSTGTTITKGTPVYSVASDLVYDKPMIAPANSSAFATTFVLGLASENISGNSYGRVSLYGKLTGLNTSGLIQGAPCFVSDLTSGLLTSTPPSASSSYTTRIGFCIKSDASAGSIEVKTHTPIPNNYATIASVANISGSLQSQISTHTSQISTHTSQIATHTSQIASISGSYISGYIAPSQIAFGVGPTGSDAISGNLGFTYSTNLLTVQTSGGIKHLQSPLADAIIIQGYNGGVASRAITVTSPSTALAANYTITLPPATGTLPTGTGAANQVAYWSGTNAIASGAALTLTTTLGATLLANPAGTSTATTTTGGFTQSITYSGIFTTGPVSSINSTTTFSGATNTAAVILTGVYAAVTSTGAITNATSVSSAYNSLTCTPGGAVGAIVFAGESHNATLTSAANVFFASGTLMGSSVAATLNNANTTGAAIAAAVVGQKTSISVQTTNASGINTIATVYGLWISPGTMSSTGGGGLTIGTLASLKIDNPTLTTMTATARYAIFSQDTANSSFAGGILTTSISGGFGYAAGAGSTVTQGTSRTTGVTLNNATGSITLFSAAGSATFQSFTLTSSAIAATDTVIINQKSGADLYEIHITNVTNGSCQISYRTTGGTTTEQPVFNYCVLKGAAS